MYAEDEIEIDKSNTISTIVYTFGIANLLIKSFIKSTFIIQILHMKFY